jgi:crossover junction endodeoxyribonuclease RusA
MPHSVTLPYPPPVLNPNCGAHFMTKHKAKKRYKHACWALVLEAKLAAPGPGSMILKVEFHPPRAGDRDDDNAISAFKAGRDGIAAALRIDDSRFVLEPYMREPVAGGKVVVTLLPLTG